MSTVFEIDQIRTSADAQSLSASVDNVWLMNAGAFVARFANRSLLSLSCSR
jgi:hypothetical protein